MKVQYISAVAAVLMLAAGAAAANPQSGFGLNIGSASHTMTPQSGSEYKSSGLSLGMDYQIALSRAFSLSPFLMTSGETTSVANVTSGHGIVGLQLRYWIGGMFVGGHLANYSEVQTATVGSVSVSSSGSGGGAGLVAGWENPKGGFFAMGQLDSANIKYSTSENKLAGFRLSIGYRWK